MKFNELKEQIELGNTNLPTLIKFNYVPLVSQQNMIDNIILISLNKDESGFMKVDYTLKKLFTTLYILANFADIEFEGLTDVESNIDSVLALEFYDFCKEHKIIEHVQLNSDCSEFVQILEQEMEQEMELSNSVASIFSQVLNNIVSKLPSPEKLGDLMKELPNIVASFNKPKSTTPRKKKV